MVNAVLPNGRLPLPDMLEATKITDPPLTGQYYTAATVIGLVLAEREACAKLVEDASAWRGGHGEPPHLSGEALAKMIRDRQ